MSANHMVWELKARLDELEKRHEQLADLVLKMARLARLLMSECSEEECEAIAADADRAAAKLEPPKPVPRPPRRRGGRDG
jgi:hypothetical protein